MKRFVDIYKKSAIVFLNTFLAVVLLNVVIWAVLASESDEEGSEEPNPVVDKYGEELLGRVYPELSEEQLRTLLDETWSRPLVYAPFVQFRERPYSGKYVTVSDAGFRRSAHQGAWPPSQENYNLFVFGGSTTFGYGVQDSETIASHLQAELSKSRADIKVYNFGQGSYYSSQERVLFESMLEAGIVPDMAMFIDGLNEFYFLNEEPMFTERLRKTLEKKEEESRSMWDSLRSLPMARLVTRSGSSRKDTGNQGSEEDILSRVNGYSEKVPSLVDRYLANKRMIESTSRSFDVKSVFVWQPIPTYNYDLRNHLLAKGDMMLHSNSANGYREMKRKTARSPMGSNFLWCADMQKNRTEVLYVDSVHYSGHMSAAFAREIARLVVERELLRTDPSR